MAGAYRWCDLPHEVSARVVDALFIELNRKRPYPVAEWLWLIAHAKLHIALGHPWDVRRSYEAAMPFALARCLVVNDMLFQLGIGSPPRIDGRPLTHEALPSRDLDALVAHVAGQERDAIHPDCGGVHGGSDIIGTPPPAPTAGPLSLWERATTREYCAEAFAAAIRETLADTIDRAGGLTTVDAHGRLERGPAARASRWIRSHMPVIGALLDRYQIVEDIAICRRMEITVAAVSDATQEIYLNPANLRQEDEYRFVIAHELLHAGLRHGERCGERDPRWWNAACDFVINGWLVEMDIGRPPAIGGLYDPELKGLSAESIYDRIQATLSVDDLRGFAEQGDIWVEPGRTRGDWSDLDAWCRNALLSGLELQRPGRGTLPAGMIEAIRALAQPPIAWDVELAHWFEREIGIQPNRRSYVRPSRRQMATPDIPRPSWQRADENETSGFAAVIDSSGSMDRLLLGKALGAVGSYAMAREVRRVRVVFCDAAAHDAGWMAPEQLLERVEVRGRGGTVLQPGIDCIESAQDFPVDGPILIVTDGACDRFVCRRRHAILTPMGARLPFVPACEVFRID
jgi:predicted metal-dependent peptidase